MDTRTKIVPWDRGVLRSIQHSGIVVTGHFDPLLADHAVRLRELAAEKGNPVIVVITEAAEPLLPAQARAELVAGIEVVDRVMVAPAGFDTSMMHAPRVVREDTRDTERTRTLIRNVHQRHALADG